jgi:hypothetical protein
VGGPVDRGVEAAVRPEVVGPEVAPQRLDACRLPDGRDVGLRPTLGRQGRSQRVQRPAHLEQVVRLLCGQIGHLHIAVRAELDEPL